MPDEEVISAMRRKAGVGRPPPDVSPMSPQKALRLAFAKAGEDAIGLFLHVSEVEETQTSVRRVSELVPDHALMSVMNGPEESYGLCVLDRNTVAAIVEQQTAGRVLARVPEERPPTSTDAVMCSEVCDAILGLFDHLSAEVPQPPFVRGFRIGAQLREPRSITLAFEDIPYRLYRIALQLGRGERVGEAFLVFPFHEPRGADEESENEAFGRKFQEAVLRSEVRLETVLCRLRLPLSEVMALQAGGGIALPNDCLTRVEVRAEDRTLAWARLGQFSGKRALRLRWTPDREGEPEGIDAASDLAPLSLETDGAFKMDEPPVLAAALTEGGGGEDDLAQFSLEEPFALEDSFPALDDLPTQ